MSTPRALPRRITSERITLRGCGAEEGTARYEIRRRGARDSIGQVAINLTAAVPVIERLYIDEQARGYGAGSETATALLRALGQQYGVVRAWAPPDRGLAVYFWIRMGFRPLMGEGPHGGLWFEQRLG